MKKILVAEDDNFLANAYRVKLTKSSYEVKIVVDGEETLQVLKNYIPDLIILDLIMPKKDGFAVLEEIKKNESLKKIPCIVASNLGQKEDIDRAKGLGADDYIIKTDLTMGGLLDKIKSFIG
jgi:DNA-binding response OmpR family regulator